MVLFIPRKPYVFGILKQVVLFYVVKNDLVLTLAKRPLLAGERCGAYDACLERLEYFHTEILSKHAYYVKSGFIKTETKAYTIVMKREVFSYVLLGVMSVIILFLCGFIYNLVYPLRYKEEIVASSIKHGLDCGLVASIIYTESHFKSDAISKSGAVGLMQLMPSTAASFCEGEAKLYDPSCNIEIGCSYLEYLFNKYGDKVMVLASYNAGETQARAWRGTDQNLDYILKVLKMEKVYNDRF